MSIYETVKAAISVKDAAEHYGLKVNRNGMACCPFHRVVASSISLAPPQAAGLVHSAAPPFPTKSKTLREPYRHPSLKQNKNYFYCFGCGATGDVTDFVARLFDLSGYEAASHGLERPRFLVSPHITDVPTAYKFQQGSRGGRLNRSGTGYPFFPHAGGEYLFSTLPS